MFFWNKRFKFVRKLNLYSDEIYLALQRTIDADSELGMVPVYIFDICLIATDERAGSCELRVGYNDSIYYTGNIGYTVFMKHRGNRYAMKACLLLFELAKKHNMKKLIITCNPDNAASAKTCDLLGAKYITTVDIPPDNIMYILGDRQKMIYEVIL